MEYYPPHSSEKNIAANPSGGERIRDLDFNAMRILLVVLTMIAAGRAFAESSETRLNESLEAARIIETMKRAADWQLKTPNRTDLRDWVIAPLYDGLIDLSETTGDPRYLAAVLSMGTQSGWMPGVYPYFADDHAVGHAWLDIYLMEPTKKERLAPFRQRFDDILAKPVTERLVYGKQPKTVGARDTDRWTWCDALYMAPPTLSRLAKATGDTRYLDFLDAEYKAAYDTLFDPAENLFYRDARFVTRGTTNGKKVFWSRGNGWVFAGLPMLMETLPANRPSLKFYQELFQKMAPAVVAAQQSDGLWYPSMLDPKEIPTGETSGSAFFVYGLAWGVNHGLLERAKYWPVVVRGWNAIVTRINPAGRVGYVQRIGDAPASLNADSTQLYGTGGVLMAGSEILRGLGASERIEPSVLLAKAEKIIADDKTPRAYARFVPERKDDLAWENDKVAFRIYGPALRASTESNGVDAWAKRVRMPVINRWYADDLAGRRGYHEDHGEGYDGYKVGDSLGCGAVAIWNNGKLIQPDVYEQARIFFTKPEVAELEAYYTYPKIDGTTYYERRTVRLRMGQHLNEVVSRFSLDAQGERPARSLEVAVGLTAQTPDAKITFRPDRGTMALWDTLQPGGELFGVGAIVSPGARMLKQPHTTSEPKADHALAIISTDQKGEVSYRAGFGWSGDGEITSEEAWLSYLETITNSSKRSGR
jgi:unsaturated rhamnogalacturonyl hydrolase